MVETKDLEKSISEAVTVNAEKAYQKGRLTGAIQILEMLRPEKSIAVRALSASMNISMEAAEEALSNY